MFESSGLIRCAECEGVITWEKQKQYVYGHCNHYRNCSQEKWVKEKEIESQVLNHLSGLKLKDSKIFEWVKKVLKESHKDKMDYHSSAIAELNQKYAQSQKRIDAIYDEKLDGKITQEFYDQKFRQYTEERDDVVRSLEKHTNADTRYLELGVSLMELAQKGKEIYALTNDTEKRRSLLRYIFKNFKLDEGVISAEYANAFGLLATAASFTNSLEKTFEPTQKPLLMALYVILL